MAPEYLGLLFVRNSGYSGKRRLVRLRCQRPVEIGSAGAVDWILAMVVVLVEGEGSRQVRRGGLGRESGLVTEARQRGAA